MNKDKKTVLFLCTHNSVRSQIAEGFLRTLYGGEYEVYSAGIKKTKVNPYAIKVLKEIGIDITKQYSKTVYDFKDQEFDIVVTVCDNAKESCPFFPGKTIIHKRIEDPSSVKGDNKELLSAFRETRDSIKNWIIEYFG
jgi:arsenate reductase